MTKIFLPFQNLIQFVTPDFFGNPATLNYWGVWNYAEFVGYIGIIPLVVTFFALFFRHDKKTLFYGSLFFLSLLFSFPTFFAKIPYKVLEKISTREQENTRALPAISPRVRRSSPLNLLRAHLSGMW